jgi:UDP-2,4-diacetamido-2,4,6-trideoxy-beta-L-altropyranose hydrolase
LKPKIYIRIDGSASTGLGHLVRCIALAHMLRNEFDITFVCFDIPDTIKKEFANNDFRLLNIKNENSFFDIIKPEYIIVLDGYHFDTEYQKQIKAKGAKLVCIDDLHDKEFVADLIINHTPGITPRDYKAQPYTQFALGPDYVLLRPVFLEQAKKLRKIEKNETLLICFGGSDFKNLTQSTLEIALEFTEFKKIIVVTGLAYQISEGFEQLVASNPRIDHRHILNEQQMLASMLEAELLIIPASGILLEALTVGCRVISGMYVENQKFVYTNYKQSGSFIDALNFSDLYLKRAIENSFIINNEKQKLIDGYSEKRILKCFQQLNWSDKLKLREAQKFDEEITFKWATDPKIRTFSFQHHTITKEEHTLWFQKMIADTKCLYLIAETDDYILGSIRFDIDNEKAIISYLIDSKYHGMGLGQILLRKGIDFLVNVKKTNNLFIKKIVGYVMKPNLPSIKAFEKLGFKKFEEKNKFKFELIIS